MNDFLAAIDDAELRHEIRDILAKMETLSEVRASTVGRSSRSSEKPDGPPGFIGLSEKHCPPEDRSLYEHFVWRFRHEVAANRSKKRLWFLLWEAQKAYEVRTVAPDPDDPRRALVLTRADGKALVKHVLEKYEGQHSYRVHLYLNLPQGWVEKIREDNDREPEHGHRRPKWRELEDWMKRDLVRQLRSEGRTQAETARWLGISRRTVVHYDQGAA